MDADGGNPKRLTSDTGDANPSWSPDGTKIAFERNTTFFPRNQLWIINADGTSPVLAIDSLAAHELSWTPQNTFIGTDLFGIVQFNPDGTGQTRILSLDPGTVQNGYPRMSPDGTRIVFQWGGASGSDSQIYTVKSDGTDLQQLTSTSGEKVYPTWSPDGLRIGFSRRENGLSIWVMEADGSNQTRVTPPPGDDFLGAWR
jgi:TolB protein